MDKFDRIQQLHRILRSHRHPVSLRKLAERMECTERTVRRTIETMQLHLDAPIAYDPSSKGWHYQEAETTRFELPGLWLTAGELQSLSLLLSLLEAIGPGLLNDELNPVVREIDKLLEVRNIKPSAFRERIRVLPITHHPLPSQQFQTLSEALLQERRVLIRYSSYSHQKTQREISPQTLVHYRENWYVDAWCHLRNDLRTFHLSRIESAGLCEAKRHAVASSRLKAHFADSYGIFAGKAKHLARLRFDAAIAREIACQQWHPDQIGEWDGQDYLLSIPYADDRELIKDILRHCPDAYVEAPAALRKKVQTRLHAGLEQLVGRRIRV